MDSEFGDETVEVGAADTEALGGGGAVPSFGLERGDDKTPLERVHRAFERRLVFDG